MKGLVAFAREKLGVDLWPAQAGLLEDWAASERRKFVLVKGRRGGGTMMSAIAAIHNAVVPDYSHFLRPGEARFIVCVATREQQAREFIRVVRELLRAAPDRDLAALVNWDASTENEVVFKTGAIVRAMPCSSRSTRGLPISFLVMDEAAHMVTTEDGYAAGKRVYQALVPSTAQFGEQGYVMVLSTPMWCGGIFWDLYQGGVTGSAADIFVGQRATWELNPHITRESLEWEFRADPDSARMEYGAEFLEGAGAFLTATAIQECVQPKRIALPPLDGASYWGAADPAFAAGGDAFSFAICHRLGNRDHATLILDRLESWRGKQAPLNSDTVLDEIAGIAKRYRVRDIVLDQYAVVPLADGFRKRGITVKPQPLTNELKFEIFTVLKQAINTNRVELLDDPALISELLHLEVRPTPGGKPKVQAARGAKDDRATAVATVLHAMQRAAEIPRVAPIGVGLRSSPWSIGVSSRSRPWQPDW